MNTVLRGPPDFMHLKPGVLPTEPVPLRARTLTLDPVEDSVWIKAGDSECVLHAGEWSEWLRSPSTPRPWA